MVRPKYFYKLFREDARSFSHIDGLRALAALRVMLHHLMLFGAFFFVPAQYAEVLKHPFFKTVMSTTTLLDIFFAISGLVIGYALIKSYKEHGKVDLYDFFVRRGARILPLYAFVVVIAAPFSLQTVHNLWANVLLVNNFLPVQEQYMAWTWALAIDLQFYILFGVFMWLLAKNVIGKKTCYATVAICFAMPFVLIPLLIHTHGYYHLSETAGVLTSKEATMYINMGFDKLYVRTSPLLFGVLSAYVLVYHKAKLLSLVQNIGQKYINMIVLGLLAIILFLMVNDPVWFFDKTPYAWQTSAYWVILFERHIFAFSFCLLLLLANVSQGFVMNSLVGFLKSKILRPFGRLSYCTFMIHPIVFLLGFFVYFGINKAITPEAYFQVGFLLIFITYLISVPLFLFLEQPTIHRVKALLQRASRRRKAMSTGALSS
ncbi:MAG: acyltransferase [Pseudomonadota bacterium]|nr:acyltransferase [Pseudomonadota bacterium]